MCNANNEPRKRTNEEIQQAFEYANSLAAGYIAVFGKCGVGVNGLNFLEIGPGQEFGAQLILASMGVKVTLCDPFLAKWDADLHPVLYQMLSEKWPNANGELKKAVAAQSHEATSLALVREPAEALASIPDESMDFVFSNAVLEHVVDMRRVAQELARVSTVGAWSSHQIDWRDHHDFSRPLEHLVLSDDDFMRKAEENWKFEYGNRLRSIEFRALFEEAGFEISDREINSWADKDYMVDVLPRIRACRKSSYANWPEDDLFRLGGRFYIRKLPIGQVQKVKSNADDINSLVNAIKNPLPNERTGNAHDEAVAARKGLFARIFNTR